MAILSPFRYPGAKNKLLDSIIPKCKIANVFGDFFVGGGSVFLELARLHPNMEFILNDKDEFISSFWKILSKNNNDLNELCRLIEEKPTLDLFYKLREESGKTDIEKAYRGIFFNRTSFSGDMRRSSSPIGGRKQESKWKIDCRYNSKQINEKIRSISALIAGRVSVYNKDILDMLDENIPCYLDPPYFKVGFSIYEKFMTAAEHEKLSIKLQEKSNWLLSYDNCQEIKDLYNWANIEHIDARYSIRGKKSSWKESKEILIMPNHN